MTFILPVAAAIGLLASAAIYFFGPLGETELVEPKTCPRCGVIIGRDWRMCDDRCPFKS
jgi:hypothetical protein